MTETLVAGKGDDEDESRGKGGPQEKNGSLNSSRLQNGLGSGAASRLLDSNSNQRRRVLLSTTSRFANNLISSLFQDTNVELRVITNDDFGYVESGRKLQCYQDIPIVTLLDSNSSPRAVMNVTAAELADWADIAVLAPVDAGTLGGLIAGLTASLTLTVLRGWDSTKAIFLVPAMSTAEWNAPITYRQLDEIHKYWSWVRVLPPILSYFEPPDRLVEKPWNGWDILNEEVRKCLQLPPLPSGVFINNSTFTKAESNLSESRKLNTGTSQQNEPCQHVTLRTDGVQPSQTKKTNGRKLTLPTEILSMIFETLNDWETARAVGVYANIPMPEQWVSYIPRKNSPMSLEYTILRYSLQKIKEKLSLISPWQPLSNLSAHLIYKFSRIDILDYLCNCRLDLFYSTPRLTTLPFRASAIYGNTKILNWWRNCPTLETQEYLTDSVDSASRAGFVHVLEWWRTSGLPLRYSERALESASAEGRIAVLDWWKNVSETADAEHPIPLKVGKSVLLAAQSGRTASLDWWDKSGIPYSNTESVARIASTHGHVPVLDLWYKLKGNKLIFDNQVLVGATKNGHVDVLEWWKRSGLRVEFKTCDIEEALEDAVSGSEEKVRRWWEMNGLNLGVGTSEWMRVKVL